MIGDLLTGVMLYLVVSAFAVVGIGIWVGAGRRKLGLHHYVTAKLLGLMLVGWVAWWGSSLRLAPFSSSVYLWTLSLALAIAAVALIRLCRPRPEGGSWRLLGWRVLRLELISLACFLAYLYLRSFNPHLESTEKFMDLAMLTGAGRTDFFPFLDFWRAAEPVNYYYFGYVLLALPLTLAGISTAVGYNLMLGLILVLTLQLSYLLVLEVTASRRAAVLGAFLVAMAGNLHYSACYLSNLWTNAGAGTACYYPKATRIYEESFTINEIPSYSFLLGDLHPHVISIPFFLTSLLMLWHLSRAPRLEWPFMALVLYTFAITAAVHVWDFMTLGVLLFLVISGRSLALAAMGEPGQAQVSASGDRRGASAGGTRWTREMWVGLVFIAMVALSPFVLFLPFFGQFDSPVAGVGFSPRFVRVAGLQGTAQYPSEPMFLLGLWGGFAILFGLSVIILGRRLRSGGPGLWFALLLAFGAAGLIVFTELFFFRDFFHLANPAQFRSNTVFKLGYHAWILLAIATAIVLHKAWAVALREEPAAERILSAVVFVILTMLVIYPLEGIRQVFAPVAPWSLQGRELTLDGSRFVKNKSAEDWAAIQWLRRNVRGRPMLLEAAGSAYSYAGRIGVFSGAINPINWSSHQWTWRFKYPEGVEGWAEGRERVSETGLQAVKAIEAEVRALYEARDRDVAIRLSRALGLEYIFIGDLERATYPDLNESLLRTLGTVVFSSGKSLLIRIELDVPT